MGLIKRNTRSLEYDSYARARTSQSHSSVLSQIYAVNFNRKQNAGNYPLHKPACFHGMILSWEPPIMRVLIVGRCATALQKHTLVSIFLRLRPDPSHDTCKAIVL